MPAPAGRIGPNIVIQTAATLVARLGEEAASNLLFASTRHTMVSLPTEMVDEATANALVRRVVQELGIAEAREILFESGLRTGDYLLKHRIPRIARLALPRLPGASGLRLLLAAIGKHTWTFAGSAHVRITAGDPAMISIARCPICRNVHGDEPLCDFYTGTFERLAQVLLGPAAWAEEVSCTARGDTACRFLISSGR